VVGLSTMMMIVKVMTNQFSIVVALKSIVALPLCVPVLQDMLFSVSLVGC